MGRHMDAVVYALMLVTLLNCPTNACRCSLFRFSLHSLILSFSTDRGDFMTSVRDGYNRYDPDSTLNGFFPFWGVVLLLLSCKWSSSLESLFLCVSSRFSVYRWRWSCRLPDWLPITTGQSSSTTRSSYLLCLVRPCSVSDLN